MFSSTETHDRSCWPSPGRRMFLRGAELLAPDLAGRIARDLWFTVPPTLAAAPLPAGAEPFVVESLGAQVTAMPGARVRSSTSCTGGVGAARQFTAYVEPLVAAGYRVALFDAPAHGDSEPGAVGPRRTHGLEFGKALDAVFARFGPAHAVIAHSLGAISTYLTLRFGWLSTERLVLLAPMVRGRASVRPVPTGARLRQSHPADLDRHLDAFVGIPTAEFDALVQAAHREPGTDPGRARLR